MASAVHCSLSTVFRQAEGHGVDGEGAEEVAAHAAFDIVESARGAVDPVDGETFGKMGELGRDVEVADQGGRAGDEEQKVFEETAERAQ